MIILVPLCVVECLLPVLVEGDPKEATSLLQSYRPFRLRIAILQKYILKYILESTLQNWNIRI